MRQATTYQSTTKGGYLTNIYNHFTQWLERLLGGERAISLQVDFEHVSNMPTHVQINSTFASSRLSMLCLRAGVYMAPHLVAQVKEYIIQDERHGSDCSAVDSYSTHGASISRLFILGKTQAERTLFGPHCVGLGHHGGQRGTEGSAM